MQLERPRFRQDLVAEPIEDGNTRFIDVMDPDSGNVFRFYEVEYSLACAMDGERDIPGIVRWAQEELGLKANPNEVKSVIATLGELGYLDGTAPVGAPAPHDEELGRGVVVGQKRVNTPVPGLELGNAGASASHASSYAEAPASNVELAAGVTTGRSTAAARPKVEDIQLGVPGRVDVSTDLSDQVGISKNDVKEAVRASKVMNAVEIPDDLKNALDSAEASAKTAARKPPPTPAKGMAAVDPRAAEAAAKAADAAKAEAARAQAEATKAADAAKAAEAAKTAAAAKAADAAKAAKSLPKPVEAKKQPEARPAVAPPAPEAKVSRPLVILLAVVALGAIAFLVYKYVLNKKTETTEVAPKLPTPPPPQPPPPPPVESEKLSTNAPQSESIKPTAAGTIEMIAANDAKVKEGDTLARFSGAKALETEIAALDKDIEQRVKTELFKAQQERDAAIAAANKAQENTAAAKVADRQKSLDDKQGKLATKKSDLDKLELKSPAEGTFTAKAKAGTKVTPTDELGMLLRAPTRTVTFKKADGGPKTRVILQTKDKKQLSCIVTSNDSAGVAITCPMDAADEGTEVTFVGIDTTPPAGSGDGSAAGSAAAPAAGSGSTGSAAAPATGSASGAAVPSPAPTRPTPPPRPAPARPAPKQPPVEKPAEEKPAEEKPAAPAGSDAPAP